MDTDTAKKFAAAFIAGGALAAAWLLRSASPTRNATPAVTSSAATYRVPATHLDAPGLPDRTLRKCETILLKRTSRLIVVVSAHINKANADGENGY